MTDQVNTREAVLDMLLEVIDGDKYSHTVLNQMLRRHQTLSKQERAFLTHLFSGTVKCYLTLDYIINQHASLPVNKMKPLIRNLLRLSVYQLFYMEQIPESAVCNEAVKLAKKRGFGKLSGFVNGVLRNIARGKTGIRYPDAANATEAYLEIMYSTPLWLVRRLLSQYPPDQVESMLAASLKEKETTIRCNQKRIAPLVLKERLVNEGIAVENSEYLPYAFKISSYDYLEKIEAFQQGYFTVQDVSSMLVCQVAGIREGDYVADICAAPGGKALHAAEIAAQVSARDLTEYKIKLIEENITRMGFTNIQTKVWDATIPDPELTGRADVVIADVPCSGIGVLGKKSDIKYKLTEKQLTELVELQRRILHEAVQYVKPGGALIFSTCTVNKAENEENRAWLLANYPLVAESIEPLLPDKLRDSTGAQGYLQLVQGIHGTDGFFISKYRKICE